MQNPIKNKIAKHANIVEMNRLRVAEELVERINAVKFEDTWPNTQKFVKDFSSELYRWFERSLLTEIVAESSRFYTDLTGDKPKSIAYPEWRLEFLEERLTQAGKNFILDLDIQERKFRKAGAGDAGVRKIFDKDFKISGVEMKEKGKDKDLKFTVGYGRWYSGYWKGVYKILYGYYTEANTSFTTELLT